MDLSEVALTIEEYESLNPQCEIMHGGTRMVFATPSHCTKWRVESIYSKEPCTLEWIASFQVDDILVDVGANVGMYSIWAAATKGIKVFAFEPEAQNYAVLNRNILANRLHGSVKAYCMGLSNYQGFTNLQIGDLDIGGSDHQVGKATDHKFEVVAAAFQQGCVVSRLDDLVLQNAIPVPNHIKIDVDGIEPEVIAGARTVLRNRAVRSLLIEININRDDHRAMIGELVDLGFAYDAEQVRRIMRNGGPRKGIAEYVFKR